MLSSPDLLEPLHRRCQSPQLRPDLKIHPHIGNTSTQWPTLASSRKLPITAAELRLALPPALCPPLSSHTHAHTFHVQTAPATSPSSPSCPWAEATWPSSRVPWLSSNARLATIASRSTARVRTFFYDFIYIPAAHKHNRPIPESSRQPSCSTRAHSRTNAPSVQTLVTYADRFVGGGI